tara:strand:+ start:79 stop:753 length:675 start_codon:yes stop_codon:yes gene_type:complete
MYKLFKTNDVITTNTLPDIPTMLCCPITNEIISDPVIDKDGHTYEKFAIVEWLSINSISPITRTPMDVNDLIPNRVYKSAMEFFFADSCAIQSKKFTKLQTLIEKLSPFFKFKYKRSTTKNMRNVSLQYYNIREIEQEYNSKFIEFENDLKQEYTNKIFAYNNLNQKTDEITSLLQLNKNINYKLSSVIQLNTSLIYKNKSLVDSIHILNDENKLLYEKYKSCV